MAAANQPDLSTPPELTLTRAERIARGIMLVQQGLTYEAAGQRVGASYVAIWRALKKLDDEWAERDENAWRRASGKAEVVAEMVLDRMAREVDRCPPSVLPAWGMFAAKVTGWEAMKEKGEGGSDAVLASILERLSKGNTVRVGVEVTPDRTESPIHRTGGPIDQIDSNFPASPPQSQIWDERGTETAVRGVIVAGDGVLSPPPVVVDGQGTGDGK